MGNSGWIKHPFLLSATFLKLVPSEYRWHTDDYMRTFGYFKPPMVIAITTIMIVFAMFWLVSHRALNCCVVGIFLLVFYLTAYEVFADITYVNQFMAAIQH